MIFARHSLIMFRRLLYKTMKKYLLGFLGLSLFLSSCSKNDDNLVTERDWEIIATARNRYKRPKILCGRLWMHIILAKAMWTDLSAFSALILMRIMWTFLESWAGTRKEKLFLTTNYFSVKTASVFMRKIIRIWHSSFQVSPSSNV